MQETTPLLDALRVCAQRQDAAFYTPGHKRGQGISQALAALLGQAVFRADLPELPELDNLFAPEGVIAQAQALAAEVLGAAQTWFLANGSTCGIEAAVLATCQPGDRLILPRNVHQSAIAALILSGAVPVFVEPVYDPVWQIAHGPTPESVAAAIAQHPTARAVLMVSPTYYGVAADLMAIAHIAHVHGLPLLVDEAHGAHFAFHPALPRAALAAGADVVVQSTHKVLGAMTQAAMLHCQGDRVDPQRLRRALALVQSTSPSYLLLASLDAARHQMAMHGEELMSHTLNLAAIARAGLSALAGVRLLEPTDLAHTPGVAALDPTRLTLDVSGLGLTGFAVDERLRDEMGVTCELPGLRHLTFIISLGNTLQDIQQLVDGVRAIAYAREGCASSNVANVEASFLARELSPLGMHSPATLTPREAFFARTETLPVEHTCDRLSAELVCPYPPGIPVLIPGERITAAALTYLRQVVAAGGVVMGCADSQLTTLRVVVP